MAHVHSEAGSPELSHNVPILVDGNQVGTSSPAHTAQHSRHTGEDDAIWEEAIENPSYAEDVAPVVVSQDEEDDYRGTLVAPGVVRH